MVENQQGCAEKNMLGDGNLMELFWVPRKSQNRLTIIYLVDRSMVCDCCISETALFAKSGYSCVGISSHGRRDDPLRGMLREADDLEGMK